MTNISSNCLLHFTPKAEYLVNILRNEFQPRYCLEETALVPSKARGTLLTAIPMICFCDLSLGQIKNHIGTYGNYGIGMTKEWGVKNKLNPIIYTSQNSNLSMAITNMVEHFSLSEEKELGDVAIKLGWEFANLCFYLKPYDGDFKRDNKIINNVRFYNEREWRYVPNLKDEIDVEQVLGLEDYENSISLAQENLKIQKFKLEFEPDDIKYIFVKNSKEILAMVKALKEIKGEKYNVETIEILTSKILTTEQVINDF